MKKLILHLGAHRAGSTAIQNFLDGKRSDLSKEGACVVLRRDMEGGAFDMRRLHRFNRLNPLWHVRITRLAKQIIAAPHHTIILSEENLVGTMPGVLGVGFYPYFPSLVAGLKALQKRLDGECTIHPRIVVRRQDRFIESVYAFRVSRGLGVSFQAFLGQLQTSQISWMDMVSVAARLMPDVDTKFAVLEAWPKGEGTLNAAQFLGLPDSKSEKPQRLVGNARFDVDKLKALLAANRAGFNAHSVFGANQLLTLPVEAVVEQIASELDSKRRSLFYDALSEQVNLSFSDDERSAFLDQYRPENQQFLQHSMVEGRPDVWR